MKIIQCLFTTRATSACSDQIHSCSPFEYVCSLQFTFEPQEGLPAVSDLRQGFLPQKIVQPPV